MLIAKNDRVSMSTNMTIYKSPKYSCFRIYNVDNEKIID